MNIDEQSIPICKDILRRFVTGPYTVIIFKPKRCTQAIQFSSNETVKQLDITSGFTAKFKKLSHRNY